MRRVEHASVKEIRVRMVSSLNTAEYSSLQMSRTSRPQIAKSRLRCAVSSYSSVSLSAFSSLVDFDDEHGAMVVAAKSPRRIAASRSSASRNTLVVSFKAAKMAMSLLPGSWGPKVSIRAQPDYTEGPMNSLQYPIVRDHSSDLRDCSSLEGLVVNVSPATNSMWFNR